MQAAPVIQLPPEERIHGSITVSAYFKYFLAGANIVVLVLMLLSFIVGEVCTFMLNAKLVTHSKQAKCFKYISILLL